MPLNLAENLKINKFKMIRFLLHLNKLVKQVRKKKK